eukprot:g48112.t1
MAQFLGFKDNDPQTLGKVLWLCEKMLGMEDEWTRVSWWKRSFRKADNGGEGNTCLDMAFHCRCWQRRLGDLPSFLFCYVMLVGDKKFGMEQLASPRGEFWSHRESSPGVEAGEAESSPGAEAGEGDSSPGAEAGEGESSPAAVAGEGGIESRSGGRRGGIESRSGGRRGGIESRSGGRRGGIESRSGGRRGGIKSRSRGWRRVNRVPQRRPERGNRVPQQRPEKGESSPAAEAGEGESSPGVEAGEGKSIPGVEAGEGGIESRSGGWRRVNRVPQRRSERGNRVPEWRPERGNQFLEWRPERGNRVLEQRPERGNQVLERRPETGNRVPKNTYLGAAESRCGYSMLPAIQALWEFKLRRVHLALGKDTLSMSEPSRHKCSQSHLTETPTPMGFTGGLDQPLTT